ncbi:MAG: ECF transporter S component [Ruminococcaceae bacterium]|nr:ECF transporter S component [Oscillospiraceae bacterium]
MIVIKNSSLRNVLRIIIPFIIMPLVVLIGAIFLNEKRHLFISLGLVFLSLIFFVSGVEKKNLGTRRLVMVSVMTALCVVGRFIPFFQPITAITVITAIYLGGESGFLVGASSAFLSNFYFGQGPWTPFQMLAWGLVGLIAGHLSNPLLKRKWLLILYGILAGVLYSFIMDVWSTLWYNGSFNFDLYKVSLMTAIPHTAIYSISNFIFLYICADPIGKKLSRIKTKYGI